MERTNDLILESKSKLIIETSIKYLIKYKYKYNDKTVYSPEKNSLVEILKMINKQGDKDFYKDGIIIRRIIIDEEYLI